MGAEDISSIGDRLNSLGVKIVGIGVETLGLDEFKQEVNFPYPIYIDEGKHTYSALGFCENTGSNCWGLCAGQIIPLSKKSDKRGYKMNFKGDKKQLGGDLLVDTSGKLVFGFAQTDTEFACDVLAVALAAEEHFKPKDTAGLPSQAP